MRVGKRANGLGAGSLASEYVGHVDVSHLAPSPTLAGGGARACIAALSWEPSGEVRARLACANNTQTRRPSHTYNNTIAHSTHTHTTTRRPSPRHQQPARSPRNHHRRDTTHPAHATTQGLAQLAHCPLTALLLRLPPAHARSQRLVVGWSGHKPDESSHKPDESSDESSPSSAAASADGVTVLATRTTPSFQAHALGDVSARVGDGARVGDVRFAYAFEGRGGAGSGAVLAVGSTDGHVALVPLVF